MTTMDDLDAAIEHFQASERALVSISESAQKLRSAQTELTDAREGLASVSAALADSADHWSIIAQQLQELTGSLTRAASMLEKAEPDALRNAVEEHSQTLHSLVETSNGLNSELERTRTTVSGGLAAATDQLAALRTRFSDEMSSTKSRIERLQTSHDQSIEELAKIQDLTSHGQRETSEGLRRNRNMAITTGALAALTLAVVLVELVRSIM